MSAFEGESEFTRDSVISGYRIIEKLGSGGGGEVYLALDTRLERKVALKFLPPATENDVEDRDRLLDEARAASRVKHPNIVSIFAFEQYRGRDFMVMEYVEGETVKKLAGGGDISIDRAISIILQIAEGLRAAHSAGIVHGDVKSENIIIDDDDTVRITDFGLAGIREVHAETGKESTSGTIPYMSPEQARGDDIDRRSDVFSLGVVAYELICGRLPFQGEFEASIIYSIANETPDPLSYFRDDIPDELQFIISKMLAKNPDDRYQDASELIDDLRKIHKGEKADAATKPGMATWKKTTALTGAAILITAVIALVFLLKPEKETPPVLPGKTIAVLPFAGLDNMTNQDFRSEFPDAIRKDLTKFSNLKIISRHSSMTFVNTSRSLQEIAALLNADYILEGTLTWDKSGKVDKVRIIPALIKMPDDVQVWTREYIRVADDILGLQSEIAQHVAIQVDRTIRSPDRARLDLGSTSNLDAYISYLRGNSYFNRSWDEKDIRLAIGSYGKAVDLDSSYALALAAQSIGHSTMYREFYDRTDKRLNLARDAALKSLELVSQLPEGHYALGMFYYSAMEYDSAMEEFNIVRKSWPGNSDIYTAIAGVQRRLGDFDKAVNNYIRAFELDPLSYLKAFDVGLTYGLSRNFREASVYLDKAMSLQSDWPLPYIYKAWLVIFENGDRAKASNIIEDARGRTDLEISEYQEYYWWLSRIIDDDYQTTLDRVKLVSDTASYYLYKAQIYRLMDKNDMQAAYCDSASAVLERKLLDRPDEARFHSQLGLAFAGMGRKEDAIREGIEAVNLAPLSKDAFYAQFLVTNLAEIYVVVGDYDSAVSELRTLLSMPGFASVPYLKIDPVWKPLYGNPEFRELISSD